ncbi:uncharacterized protein LOC118356970 [Zalophus californianus]|uniref:Uncharacterized protein LOC118356970 n=1 Tax=Zalophus californianus TaxID=9704 RepID=A0A6P9FBL3_ZALCA|nr:uncharacterized protein LOC118356970 [Zalophus californianus]
MLASYVGSPLTHAGTGCDLMSRDQALYLVDFAGLTRLPVVSLGVEADNPPLTNHQKVNSSLMLCHNAYIIHLTSSHQNANEMPQKSPAYRTRTRCHRKESCLQNTNEMPQKRVLLTERERDATEKSPTYRMRTRYHSKSPWPIAVLFCFNRFLFWPLLMPGGEEVSAGWACEFGSPQGSLLTPPRKNGEGCLLMAKLTVQWGDSEK